jgi:hypothetical protein
MADFLSQVRLPARPEDDDCAVRWGDVKPLYVTRAELDALMTPPGSGVLPPEYEGRRIIVTDEPPSSGGGGSGGGGSGGGGLGPWSTIEQDTGEDWIDGKRIFRITFSVPGRTPELDGEILGYIPDVDTLVDLRGIANLVQSGSWGSWFPLGGSAFGVALKNDGAVLITGPDTYQIHRIHVTAWYTKVG